jgi:hypothetical protein
LAKGHAKRAQAIKDNPTTAGERWAMLLDGRLTVRDLTDKEIAKCKVKGRGIAYSTRAMPSHLAAQFAAEQLRRAKRDILDLQTLATSVAKDLLVDPDTPPAVRTKIIDMLWDRNLGRNAEHVKIEADSGFAAALREVFVDRGDSAEDLADELARLVAEEG